MSSSNSTLALLFAAAGLVLVLYAMGVSEQSRNIYGHSLSTTYDAPPPPHAARR
jgi:hypothetical protein